MMMNSLNEFMTKKASNALQGNFITKDYETYVMNQAKLLSVLGISDEMSLRKFHHISQLVPIFVRRATNYHDNKLFSKVANYVYEQRSTINNDADVRYKVIEALVDMQIITKKAYPSDASDQDPIPTFDTQKWINALHDANLKQRLFGVSRAQILSDVTRGWSEMENNKFSDWVRFYEQGGHLVYKTAQTYTTESGISVPFTNSNNNVVKMSPIPGLMDKGNDAEAEVEARAIQSKLDQKKIDQAEAFQKIRNSIIGRISSAKKLISSGIGRQLVGPEYEKLLSSLLQLEKDLLVLKNDRLLEDVVARAEAGLIAQGHKNAAFMLVKIAQDANPFGGDTPPPPALEGDSGGGGGDDEIKKAIAEAFNNTSTWPEKNLHPTNEEIRKQMLAENKENAPPPAPATPPPATPAPGGDAGAAPPPPPPVTASYQWANYRTAEVVHFELVVESVESIINSTKQIYKLAQRRPMPAAGGSNVTKFFEEEALDKAFANIKLSDVIKRMQALSRVFKNREIARQLSIIDLMLDRLGIAGLFPQLAEATKSALESNQYSSIRVEEVLSKLMSLMDEGGNVNAQVNSTVQPSLVDHEMQKALMSPDVINPSSMNENPMEPPMNAPAPGNVSPLPPVAPNPSMPGLNIQPGV